VVWKARDDIYAFGATLYELLTGKPPFHTGDVATQIREVMPKPVNARLATLGLDPVPAEWEGTIQACLAKEPEHRPKSAAEVAERLGLGETAKHAKGREGALTENRTADRRAEHQPVPPTQSAKRKNRAYSRCPPARKCG
jgi:serine/threonine protein kinase